MAGRIAILRGINVGGKRKIIMKDLKILFLDMGFRNVETYIQSGNVFFDSDENLSDIEISEKIEYTISNKYDFEVPVIVRSEKDIEEVIQINPFYEVGNVNVNQLHLTFLKDTPTSENCAITESYNFKPDRFKIMGNHVFVYCEGKYHQTKLNNNFFENKLKTAATTRNWKTVLKLLELSK